MGENLEEDKDELGQREEKEHTSWERRGVSHFWKEKGPLTSGESEEHPIIRDKEGLYHVLRGDPHIWEGRSPCH